MLFNQTVRTFSQVMGAHEKIVEDVMKMGRDILPETVHSQSTAGLEDELTTREVCNYSFVIHNLSDLETVLDSTVTACNKAWAQQEFLDRIENAPNPGRAYLVDPKWKKMLEEDGKFSYTYGERWAKQLPAIIAELKEHPNTRQAILTTWDSNEDQERLGKRRIPCSVYSQFLLRDGKLHQIYNIRSNDAIFIMPSDLYQQGMIQRHIAEQVGVQVGELSYTVGSLHLYKKHAKLIEEKLGLKW